MKRSLLLFGLVALSACGDICTRQLSAEDSLADKAAPCGLTGFEKRAGEERERAWQSCDALRMSCTGADLSILNAYYDCIESVKTCEAGKEADFVSGLTGCSSKLDGLSESCS